MSEYRVTMLFEFDGDLTEDQFWHRLYGSTKHSNLSWAIENFEEVGTEENDCE